MRSHEYPSFLLLQVQDDDAIKKLEKDQEDAKIKARELKEKEMIEKKKRLEEFNAAKKGISSSFEASITALPQRTLNDLRSMLTKLGNQFWFHL